MRWNEHSWHLFKKENKQVILNTLSCLLLDMSFSEDSVSSLYFCFLTHATRFCYFFFLIHLFCFLFCLFWKNWNNASAELLPNAKDCKKIAFYLQWVVLHLCIPEKLSLFSATFCCFVQFMIQHDPRCLSEVPFPNCFSPILCVRVISPAAAKHLWPFLIQILPAVSE